MTDPSPQSEPPAASSSPWASPTASSTLSPRANGLSHPTGNSWTRYLVLAWLCTAAIIAYICRNSLGVAEKAISEEFGLSTSQMGQVMSAFFLSYALCSIPGGRIGQALGSRRMLSGIAVLWSLFTITMAMSVGYWTLIASRMAGGIAQTGLFPACTGTVGRWFPRSEKAIASGALGSFMSVGGAIGAGATGLLLTLMGWRLVFCLYGLLGLAWSVLFYYWFRDRPEDHAGVSQKELAYIRGTAPSAPPSPAEPANAELAADAPSEASATTAEPIEKDEPTPWASLAASPAMWWISSQQFCRAAAYIFFASWFPRFLRETQDVSLATAGLLTMVPLLSVVVGGLGGGLLSDLVLARTNSIRWARCGVSGAAMLLAALCFLLAFWIGNLPLLVTVIGLGTFFGSIAGPCSYAITIDMGGKHVPTVFGTMNMWGNLGAVIFPTLAPLFVKWTGDWNTVLPLCAGIYLVAAVSWLLLRTDGSIFDQSLIPPPRQEPA